MTTVDPLAPPKVGPGDYLVGQRVREVSAGPTGPLYTLTQFDTQQDAWIGKQNHYRKPNEFCDCPGEAKALVLDNMVIA